MTRSSLEKLIDELLPLPNEAEWIEFKLNNEEPLSIGENISAIANATALLNRTNGYIVWGIDNTHNVVGTKFKASTAKKGAEELQNWLSHLLNPRLDFRIQEFAYQDKPMVLINVPAASYMPVRFNGEEYIRVGSATKKLKEFPDKERNLWAKFRHESFEKGIASASITAETVLELIDYPAFFELLGQPLPENRIGILERLKTENVIQEDDDGKFQVTNLGAILFARRLEAFDGLKRKAMRVIQYKGTVRTETLKEQLEVKGYAVGFELLIDYINNLLPSNEEIGRSLRREVRMYPEIAIRELVANAIIHQDFLISGTGPMVEIFSDRIEITNPGVPLIDPLRFIDEPPRSRNEALAAFMRRLNICEERGSGIDKVIFQIEFFQLPPPDFQESTNHTKVILYAPQNVSQMKKSDRIRACYQHACLCYVSNKKMTNATLRERFGIKEENSSMASRFISETMKAGRIKASDPENNSKKHAQYVPFWL